MLIQEQKAQKFIYSLPFRQNLPEDNLYPQNSPKLVFAITHKRK